MSEKNRKLRFAALRRVSTEKQEEKGESLAVQTKSIEKAVKELGGSIVAWYGGQEHATPGFEKKEVTRLLVDAKKRRFDAVSVADPFRWSRDNSVSQDGLEVFKSSGIRFFTGTQEWNLFNPTDLMFLAMSAVMGGYVVGLQNLRSLESRIERANQGNPSAGRLPFGRTWDEKIGWGIDKKKKAIIQDCAKRYLAKHGESIVALAAEYGMNASNLHKILTKSSGAKWQIKFNAPKWNKKATVAIEIPRLLDEKTIKRIRSRAAANRTFLHGHIKHHYLLSRAIFCIHCGYAMFGQTNKNGKRYYRHLHTARVRPCKDPARKMWIPADEVENAVVRQLFETFGNPAAVERAIEAATLSDEGVIEAKADLERVREELEKVNAGRQRVLNRVNKGTVTEEEADAELSKSAKRKEKLEARLSQISDALAHLPDKAKVTKFAQSLAVRRANCKLDRMTYEERRQLIQTVFSGKQSDGSRMGVMIHWDEEGKRYGYILKGHLIDEAGPVPDEWLSFGWPHKQNELAVTKSATH